MAGSELEGQESRLITIPLRDHLAGMAMMALVNHPEFVSQSCETVAGAAYDQADAMLKARETTR